MFLFGKKKSKKVHKRTSRKPPAALIKRARKYGVKVSKKVGKKRVYKSVNLIKRQIKKKMRLLKKRSKRHSKRHPKRSKRTSRRSRFGNTEGEFNPAVPNYGYNQPVVQMPPTVGQSAQVVTPLTNMYRPLGMQVPIGTGNVYGTYKEFFGSQVPSVVAPEYTGMGQPDGSTYALGSPFYAYRSPAFGKRRRTRRRY